MTPEEFARRMEKIASHKEHDYYFDDEVAHVKADELMMEVLESLGYKEGVRIFDDMAKYYS